MTSRPRGDLSRLFHDQSPGTRPTQTFAALRCVVALAFLLVARGTYAAAPDSSAIQLNKAAALHRQADYAHSVPILRRIVKGSPRNYDANLLLGEDLLNSGDVVGAILPLELACKLRPRDGTAEVYLAEAAIASEDFSKAAEALQAGIARSHGSAPFLESWASFCLQRFKMLEQSLRTTKRGEATALRVEAAIRPEGSEIREKVLEQSAAEDPEQRGIWGELGMAQLERGMHTRAQESLKQAERREAQEAETLQLEALLAAVEKNWPVAEERLTAVGARSPAELDSVVKLWRHMLAPTVSSDGTTWDCLRNATASCPSVLQSARGGSGAHDLYNEGRWEQLLALPMPSAGDRSELFWRGVALARTGNCTQAIPFLERGLKADEVVASFWLDVCYSSEGQRVVASLSQQGNTTALHRLRGDMLLVVRSDAGGAELEYKQALQSDPENPHLLEKLATACLSLGDTDQAGKFARAALAVDAHEFSALQTLAEMAMKERNYVEALDWLKQLFAIDPKDSWTQVELGLAFGQLGHPEEAQHYLAPRLAAGYPDDKGALHAMLANALRKLGREDEAKQAATEAARLANSSLESNGRENSESGSVDASK